MGRVGYPTVFRCLVFFIAFAKRKIDSRMEGLSLRVHAMKT